MYVCPARLSSSPISHSNKLHRRLREPIGSHFSQPSSYLINYLSTLGPLSRARRELLQPPRILQGPPKPSCRRASPRDRERSFLRRSASPRDRQRRTITTMMATTPLTTTNLPRYHRTGVKPTKDTVDTFCKALYSVARGKLSPVDPLGHDGAGYFIYEYGGLTADAPQWIFQVPITDSVVPPSRRFNNPSAMAVAIADVPFSST